MRAAAVVALLLHALPGAPGAPGQPSATGAPGPAGWFGGGAVPGQRPRRGRGAGRSSRTHGV